jgi:hypothetical protein
MIGDTPTGYMESDKDYVLKNIDACIAFLDSKGGSK